jgi:DNA-binding CsgD family transcriptional regulator
VEGLYVDERPSWLRSVTLILHDRFDEARRHIRSFIDEALDRGEENALPTLRFHLTWLESLAGNWREAEDEAERGYEEAVQTQQPAAAARILHYWALTHALQGRLELAGQEAGESLRRLQDQGQAELVQARAHCVLGFIALAKGDPAGAVAELSPLQSLLRRAGVGEPGAYRFAHDLAEAYVLSGDHDTAETVVGELEEQGRRLDRAYALATGARGRGLVLAAKGDVDGALAALEGALVEHERLPQPFELGRTLLALGQVQRRGKLKREARGSLERALAMFDRLGAGVWAERARAELTRIGGRAPGVTSLTATEERVAALAAQGMTNREIAGQLFMTVRTVEWNLSKVYRKLHLRSRTELARAVGRP